MRERVLEPLGLALDGLERRRPAAAAGRDGYRPAGDGLHGRGAAGRRRLLRGARRPLQQRARPGALERGVPRRGATARRARGGAREPRDAARDARARSAFRARRRMAVAGRAARRGRRRLRLRPDDLARARRAAARRASRRPARIRHADALGARARPERDPARQRHLREVRGPGAARARAGRPRGRAAAPQRPRAIPGCWPRATRSTALVARWDDDAAARLFTPQRRSRPPAARAARTSWRRCASATARSRRDGDLEHDDALRGRWRLRGERGHVELAITLAPTVPPLVQTLSVESVLPPSGRLATLAAERGATRERARRRRARRAARARGRRRRGGAARPARGRRAVRPVRRARGRSAATARRRSTLRLPGPRGDVELELELDEGGKRLAQPRAAPGARAL